MATTILPYKSLGQALNVSLDFSKAAFEKLSETTFLFDKAVLGPTLPIKIAAAVPAQILDAFPPAERVTPPLKVLATFISVDGGAREFVPLVKGKSNLYDGVLNLDLTRISEVAEISVYAVRSTPGSAKGFAQKKGARLAWSPTQTIRFTLPQKKGNFLRTVWEDFSESSDVPSGFDNALYFVDAQAEPPVLYLNKQSKAPLVKLFETAGQGHQKALPRDLLFASVATSVWFTLAQTALAELHREAQQSGVPVDLEEAFGSSWKKELIELLAPRVLPQMMEEDAIQEFCTKMNDTKYYLEVLLKAQLAIQVDQKLQKLYEQFSETVFKNG